MREKFIYQGLLKGTKDTYSFLIDARTEREAYGYVITFLDEVLLTGSLPNEVLLPYTREPKIANEEPLSLKDYIKNQDYTGSKVFKIYHEFFRSTISDQEIKVADNVDYDGQIIKLRVADRAAWIKELLAKQQEILEDRATWADNNDSN